LVVGVWALVVGGCRGAGAGDEDRRGPEVADKGRWALVEALASNAFEGRAPGSPGGEKARAKIREALEACGWDVGEHATRGPGVNLVARYRGAAAVERFVLVSAHYDHLGVVGGQVMNGADDNAAAVGAVVEVACRYRPGAADAAGLIVALWDSEEPPYFMTPAMGSASWVAQPTVPLDKIDVAIVLDLVGGGLWAGASWHVVLGGETSKEVAAVVARAPVPAGLEVLQAGLHLVEEIVATGRTQPWSDYAPFRAAGVPVLFLSNGQSHHYHTAGDDFETLDLKKLGLQTDWLAGLLGELVRHPTKPRFDTGVSERAGVDTVAAARLVDAALALAAGSKAGASSFDVEVLRRDREALGGDGMAGTMARRRAVQRVQCFASGQHPAALCAAF